MYIVDPETFKKFISKNHLADGLIPKPKTLPCIIEFPRGDVLKAKVEVYSYDEFLAVVKFGKDPQSTKNKYWIRGDEWKIDENGEAIQELAI